MQKRIDDLNKQLKTIIDRMRGYPAFDIQGYNELKAQRLTLQKESTWLSDIQSLLPLRLESDSYDEQFHQVAIRLTFPPHTIVSPLNKWVYDIADTRSTGMHTIQTERMSYQFVYDDTVIGKLRPQMIADQIMHSYVRLAKPLDDMLEGVRFANIALQYIDWMQKGGITTAEFKLQRAATLHHSVLRYAGEELEILDEAVTNDDYLKHIETVAKGYWPTTRKLIAFTLMEGRYNIDWQPFELGLATSR